MHLFYSLSIIALYLSAHAKRIEWEVKVLRCRYTSREGADPFRPYPCEMANSVGILR